MGKVKRAPARETIALDMKEQSAFTKAVRKVKKSMKTKKLEAEEKACRGIILVSHLPYGFFEDELKGFFSQFGKVTKIRLARSIKTGRSKGYAFIQFEFLEVAKIAAEAMNNYLMYERLIKCKVIDDPKINTKKIFGGRPVRKGSFPTLFRRKRIIDSQKVPLDTEEIELEVNARPKRIVRNNEKLAQHGIDYKYEDVSVSIIPSTTNANAPNEKGKTLKKTKGSPKLQSNATTPEAEGLVPRKKKKTSPKSNTSPKTAGASPAKVKVEASTSPNRKASPKIKSSPKVLPALKENTKRKSSKTAGEASPVERSSEKLRISPKLLRSKSRKSEGSIVDGGLAKKKTPEESKFSPKLLRSKTRKSQGSTSSAETNKKQSPEKPKFSPKLLRSKTRKSEGSVLATPNTKTKQRPARRKSIK